ncbi:DUF1554 domain-containing protein [Leptospira stimsonii]|uniref:DUF1554 domain-containing protein n=1 Tax=Leptospira stimsonii TaxID=2202203 RepID=A0ABY2MUG1_9LEPT|nr:DUF1554 domain-containing protein [Leptospira stimsonii]TGK15409.1 DUF1554 domain-containing protein [Leptospira stimsonii]TGM08273.1 DUF1554 domain-containing protein [Leptospira stimsonii]
MNCTRNFFSRNNRGFLARFVSATLVVLFPLTSCTLWPILTTAVVSKSESDNSSSSLLLLLLAQGAGSSNSTSGTTPTSSPGQATCAATGCSLFLTSVPNGNFGGVTGADASCAAQAAVIGAPGNATGYKAFIMAEDGTRSLSTSWVLYPNANYYSIDNSNLLISTTDANGQFAATLTNEITPSAGLAYTGIDTSGATWIPKTGQSCVNAGASWTSISAGVTGWVANPNSPGIEIGGAGTLTCATASSIYCVQR